VCGSAVGLYLGIVSHGGISGEECASCVARLLGGYSLVLDRGSSINVVPRRAHVPLVTTRRRTRPMNNQILQSGHRIRASRFSRCSRMKIVRRNMRKRETRTTVGNGFIRNQSSRAQMSDPNASTGGQKARDAEEAACWNSDRNMEVSEQRTRNEFYCANVPQCTMHA